MLTEAAMQHINGAFLWQGASGVNSHDDRPVSRSTGLFYGKGRSMAPQYQVYKRPRRLIQKHHLLSK